MAESYPVQRSHIVSCNGREPDWRARAPIRFSLRWLLLAVLILCVIFTLIGSRIRSIERQQAAAAKLQLQGAHVSYEYGNVVSVQPYGEFSDDDLALLDQFPNLTMLFLQDSHASDKALEHIQQLTQLEWLVLIDLRISDAGIARLKSLPRLRNLFLQGTLVTDQCIADLAEMTQLEHLNLKRTNITDDGATKLRRALPNTEIDR